jgi:hypothetical protein
MHSSALDYSFPPFLDDLSSPQQGFSYDHPIQIPPSPDPLNKPGTYSTYQDPFEILSLRATASNSTPSIDTPVHNGFAAHPIIADDSGHNFQGRTPYSYSGQEVPSWMPSDVFHLPPFVPSSKPSSNGAISAHQAPSAPSSALHHSHPVMSKSGRVSLILGTQLIDLVLGHHLQHPSLVPTSYSDHSHVPSSGVPIFPASGCHAHATSFPPHVYPTSLVQHHQHSESSMTFHYDMTTSTTRTTQASTTTTTVHRSQVASANVCPEPVLDPHQAYPSCASICNASQRPSFAQHRFISNGLQPQAAPSHHSFPYVTSAPVPTLRAASVPLYQPKPTRPLPEWTRRSSLVSDQLVQQVSPSHPTTVAHAVPSPPRASTTFSEGCGWVYGPSVASATIEEILDPQDISFNDDDRFDDDGDDGEYDDEEDDDDDDQDTDMDGTECGFEMEKFSGFDMATPEFQMTPSDPPAFRRTLSSAAVPLSSSSLLCQPISDVVQNQFRPLAAQKFLNAASS